MPRRSTFSALLDRLAFDGLAGELVREAGADALLSVPGHPAATVPLIGVGVADELVFTARTTPDQVRAFCFGSPGPAFGFVSYTYGLILRGIPSTKPLDFPLGHLKKYAAVAEYDHASGMMTLVGQERTVDALKARLEGIGQRIGLQERAGVSGFDRAGVRMSLPRAAYETGVRETLARIRAGDVYQLNLSTRFTGHWPGLDPAGLFLHLWRTRPAPFYACFASGPHRVISTSPERFLRVQGELVLSQPIKGTLRLKEGEGETDPEVLARLTGSAKEDAELSMIVDLIRNDISACCQPGSVRVEGHKSVFCVDRLLQMYSNVTGRLRDDRDCLDLFFNAFPGGSVTGCPKASAMTIIEALEPHSRGVYCGSMLAVRGERELDSSIAIRTAAWNADTGNFDFWAGSGIVVDSDPASEYQETLAKAEKFLTLEGP
ncbi:MULTISPECIES: chorismate-binding protein [Pseudodesulfovibrio]|uniref:Chorismate binding-like protein n=1 Tax=Pseudodesulfovibrio aespoeensis (strain ATCC 700646 / DSM 10631 / Aspo-2) TaxID=643562 RepID=E6VSG9_PSEA9|nr:MULTISPECIES: chorismate-binding protein [Pseudodesulfovibrio]ADU64312.1 Chorismate binding-like protein [Pseudodesulfovibrio aespoeensis Aspo-2]MCG2733512.1 anthranilate synthase component I family protein [Pseudodesulfovibrio aespoeensis]